MNCSVTLAVILYRSVVYIKGFAPQKIYGAKKRLLKEHIILWNIIVNSFISENNDRKLITCSDIIKYISENKTLSSTISVGSLSADNDKFIGIGEYEDVLLFMRMLVSEITVMFFSKGCDYKKLFVYIRALHNLPRCFFSANDSARISKADAIAYMEKTLS